MKGNRKQIFLLGFYLVLLLCLLALQYCYIDGRIPRLLANGITMVLIVPCALLMREWKNTAEADDGEKEAAEDRELVWKEFLECVTEYSLTKRETEVAWLIYRKYANAQIGEELFISETTVKKHAGHIYGKMSVSGRKELIEMINNKWEGLLCQKK